MTNKRIFTLLLLLLGLVSAVEAQTTTKMVLRKGNKAYHKQDYSTAEQSYRTLLKKDSVSAVANFALGSTLYQQGKNEEAKQVLAKALEAPNLSREKQADILHNLGNISMKAKQYAEAVKSYEESLILDPTDDETRYNLVLAQKLLQQQKQNQNQQQQDNNQPNDPNKDKQQEEQNQDKNNQDKQNKQNPEQNKDKDKQGKQNPNASNPAEPKPQDGQLSKEQAEQILDAYKQNDDKTRRRVEQEQREQKQERNNKVKRKW